MPGCDNNSNKIILIFYPPSQQFKSSFMDRITPGASKPEQFFQDTGAQVLNSTDDAGVIGTVKQELNNLLCVASVYHLLNNIFGYVTHGVQIRHQLYSFFLKGNTQN